MANRDAAVLTGKLHSQSAETMIDWCLEPVQTLIVNLFENTILYCFLCWKIVYSS